jgi:hypothetical protein
MWRKRGSIHPLFHKSSWSSAKVKVKVTLRLTVGQSVSTSWYWALLWDLWPYIISCRNVAVWNLRSHFCGTPSLTRGRVYILQCNHSMVLAAHNPVTILYCLFWGSAKLEGQVPVLISPGTWWPSYTSRHWVPFTSPLTTRRTTVEVL